MSDKLLAFWLFTDLLWSMFVIGGTTYLVFWRGHSGWWFVLSVGIVGSPTLYKALNKRFVE